MTASQALISRIEAELIKPTSMNFHRELTALFSKTKLIKLLSNG
ncbi:hypothetical protein IMCC20628_03431 [Hoeflea sp. IMCC20628]|nr:hypothetical protein IMCC20628_03431 [Hoeflea sp. IMCC20628]